MRRIAVVLVLSLVAHGCGDDDAAPTSTTAPDDTTAGTSPATSRVTTIDTSPTTEAAVGTTVDAAENCREIWPEPTVQAVFGNDFTLLEANADSTACIFTSLPDSVTMSWYPANSADFETSKAGASTAATSVEDLSLCDAGYAAEVAGALVIVEGYSQAQGRVYTATIAGVELEGAADRGSMLVAQACAG